MSQQGENKQQTQPAYGNGPVWNQAHIGGRQAQATFRNSPLISVIFTCFFSNFGKSQISAGMIDNVR